MKYKNTPGDVG